MSKAAGQGRPRIQLLDGAMGTTLEGLGCDVSGPMWGSDLLDSNPEAIARVHEGYVGVGVDLIETATYQMSLGALLSDHTRAEAETIMRSAIHLAADCASKTFNSSVGPRSTETENAKIPNHRRTGVVLSLGPYGATLSPSQEYAGIYPPPYGPTPTTSGDTSSFSNVFPVDPSGQALQEAAVEALAEWHLSRLRVYAGEEAGWRKVQWVGFETVPLLTEICAIRRAMGTLREELREKWGISGNPSAAGQELGGRQWWDKRFWISSAYPDGLHPQNLRGPDGAEKHATIDDVIDALIGSTPSNDPPADGIGINCTHPAHIANLTRQFTTVMINRLSTHPLASPPVFVLYPDGGAVYDTTTRTWTERTTEPQTWAQGVSAIAGELDIAGGGEVWGGIIAGGCCKAGFEEIEHLRKELHLR